MQVERHSIDFIPESERHGSAKSLFTIWFSANAQITTVVTGALAVILGLDLWSAILAILIGNAIGGVFMAYHSAQGPKLGIPQMIQSRAQFGVVGAILPLILVVVMYVGFFATSTILGAQALTAAFHLPLNLSIIIVNVLAVILCVYGYDFIHRFEKVVAVIFLILFLILTFLLLKQPMPAVSHHSFSWGPFLLVLSIMATWQITFAPYTADYSRYLPKETSTKQTFWYTYFGAVVGSSWMMVLGAIAAIVAPKQSEEMVSYFGHLAGSGLALVTYIVIVLGVLAINTLNLYGGFMSVVTTIDALVDWKITAKVRTLFVLIVAVVGTGLSIWGQGNFLNNYSNFLLLLLYFMVPWTSINLVDFYWLRRGEYNIQAIFDINGEYGKVNAVAIWAYILGIVLQFPFMNTEIYVGPVAKWLNGADLAWIVGLIVPALIYYSFMSKKIGVTTTTNKSESL